MEKTTRGFIEQLKGVKYEQVFTPENQIKVGNTVFHQLSKLYFKCENKKQERWMNMNPYYILVPDNSVDEKYFKKGS